MAPFSRPSLSLHGSADHIMAVINEQVVSPLQQEIAVHQAQIRHLEAIVDQLLVRVPSGQATALAPIPTSQPLQPGKDSTRSENGTIVSPKPRSSGPLPAIRAEELILLKQQKIVTERRQAPADSGALPCHTPFTGTINASGEQEWLLAEALGELRRAKEETEKIKKELAESQKEALRAEAARITVETELRLVKKDMERMRARGKEEVTHLKTALLSALEVAKSARADLSTPGSSSALVEALSRFGDSVRAASTFARGCIERRQPIIRAPSAPVISKHLHEMKSVRPPESAAISGNLAPPEMRAVRRSSSEGNFLEEKVALDPTVALQRTHTEILARLQVALQEQLGLLFDVNTDTFKFTQNAEAVASTLLNNLQLDPKDSLAPSCGIDPAEGAEVTPSNLLHILSYRVQRLQMAYHQAVTERDFLLIPSTK